MYARKNIKGPALDLLDQSVQVGLSDYANLLVDSDMTNLRSELRFQKVLSQMRSEWDYMYVLGRAGAYDTTQQTTFPAFTYAPSTDSNLVALRKAFNLDSIAGKGNESSRVINILQWIHYLIPHDGNHDNPVVKNAMSMIAQCKREDRGLNCRGLATVLNECYLAMGFKSRFVTCLPKDSLHIDNDCHVINLVYLPSLKKWVWMDPTFDAYVMNEKGQLLSIPEVRERLVNHQPLIVNPEANWNRKSSESLEEYLHYYMAKNLYLLECSTYYGYDTETRTSGKTVDYVYLLPLDYFNQGPAMKHNVDEKTGFTTNVYKTNNPNAFWSTPQ